MLAKLLESVHKKSARNVKVMNTSVYFYQVMLTFFQEACL